MITRAKVDNYLEPWQASLFAGIFSSATSIFDLLWSVANMLHEDHPIIFYILFVISIESVIFILVSSVLFFGLAKKKSWCLVPWMIVAIIDITLDLTHNLVEISLPVSSDILSSSCLPMIIIQMVPEIFLRWKRNHAAPCILALTGLLIRLVVCMVMIYAIYSVYRQYKLFNENESKITKIKIFPAEEEDKPSEVKTPKTPKTSNDKRKN